MRSVDYPLTMAQGTGVNGKVTISENKDNSFNVLVSIDSSVKDTVHVVHIHNGSITNPGSIALSLTNITGTGAAAQSLTSNITSVTFPDSSMHTFTYDSIVKFNGNADVHYSAFKMDSLISHGNIGSNSN